MKIRPTFPFHILGAPHNLRLDPSQVYPAIHATNQPDWQEEGKIFVPFDSTDTECQGESILLENGEYTLIEP